MFPELTESELRRERMIGEYGVGRQRMIEEREEELYRRQRITEKDRERERERERELAFERERPGRAVQRNPNGHRMRRPDPGPTAGPGDEFERFCNHMWTVYQEEHSPWSKSWDP